VNKRHLESIVILTLVLVAGLGLIPVVKAYLVLYVYEDFDDATTSDSGWVVDGDYSFTNGYLQLMNPGTPDGTPSFAGLWYREENTNVSFNNFTWSFKIIDEEYDPIFAIRYFDNYTTYIEGVDLEIKRAGGTFIIRCWLYNETSADEIFIENVTDFWYPPNPTFTISIVQNNTLILKAVTSTTTMYSTVDISACQLGAQKRSILEVVFDVSNWDPYLNDYGYIDRGWRIDDLLLYSDTEYTPPTTTVTETVTTTETTTVTTATISTTTVTTTETTTSTVVSTTTTTETSVTTTTRIASIFEDTSRLMSTMLSMIAIAIIVVLLGNVWEELRGLILRKPLGEIGQK